MPKLLQHIASGKASDELQQQLQSVLESRRVDTCHSLHLEDGRELITMLEGRQGQQVWLRLTMPAGADPASPHLQHSGHWGGSGIYCMFIVPCEAVQQHKFCRSETYESNMSDNLCCIARFSGGDLTAV